MVYLYNTETETFKVIEHETDMELVSLAGSSSVFSCSGLGSFRRSVGRQLPH